MSYSTCYETATASSRARASRSTFQVSSAAPAYAHLRSLVLTVHTRPLDPAHVPRGDGEYCGALRREGQRGNAIRIALCTCLLGAMPGTDVWYRRRIRCPVLASRGRLRYQPTRLLGDAQY
eukprot:2837887-Rhodomonas_salina.2